MSTTTAKLAELLEATSPGCDCDSNELIICVHRTEALDHLEDIAPDLARLVLTLTKALDNAAVSWHSEHESASGPSRYQDCERWEVCRDATEAFTVVEELKL